jgi:cyclin B
MSAAPQPAGPATRTRTALGDLSNKYSQLKDPVRAGKVGGKGLPGKSSSASAARGVFDRSTEDAGRSAPKSPVDKVDMPDVHNPQAVIPYLHDIHRHYREAEAINLASGTYMSKQTDINEKMRAILIDWLIEVHLKFKLMIETLYLTVNLIDRFLEKETITRNKLQLVGVTAMFLASKYEEIYAPECRDFVYISDKAYTREQILAMEGAVLAKLNFQLTTPNTYVFLKRFSKVAGIIATPRSKTELLANMFVELTLQEYKFLKYLPSMVAASAVYLALKTMGQPCWGQELAEHTSYTEAALLPCVRDMNQVHKDAPKNNLQAVRKKYAQEKHGAVSGIPPANL